MSADLQPGEYGSEEELVEDFILEYSWKFGDHPVGIKDGKLDPRWNGNGLFGELGRHPNCIRTPGLGKGAGSRTIYVPGALDRLRYIVTAAEFGLGAEKIKTALEYDIPGVALQVCANEKSIRYLLTRPLALLLNARNLSTLDKDDVYKKVWKPFGTPRRDRAGKGKPKLGSPDPAYLLARANRDRLSLEIYLTKPRSVEDYVADLGRPESQPVVNAMRRIVNTDIARPDTPLDGLNPKDITLVEKHARDGYAISIRRCPPAGQDDVVYACAVSQGEITYTMPPMQERVRSMSRGQQWREIATPPRPMTLLEHSCSQLLSVLDERDRWIRRCRKDRWNEDLMWQRCPVLFAVYYPKGKTCGTTLCKKNFDGRKRSPSTT